MRSDGHDQKDVPADGHAGAVSGARFKHGNGAVFRDADGAGAGLPGFAAGAGGGPRSRLRVDPRLLRTGQVAAARQAGGWVETTVQRVLIHQAVQVELA